MDPIAALAQGLTVALQPMNLLFALIGVLLGTAVGVLPGIGPALTVALLLPVTYKLDPGRLADHVRRHLLRRHVWRLDHRDPDQHAGRERLAGDRARRQQDGEGRPRRAGARDRRHRLVRRRHHRHHRHRVPGALAGRGRDQVRPGGLFRADVRRLHHGVGDLRQFADPRPHLAVRRADARPRRHRQAHRPVAACLRRAGAARRRRDHDARGRAVRGRRSALRRLAPASASRRRSSRCAARSG